MNSSNDNHPKFLMQVNRQQPVPKLVSINQYQTVSEHQHRTSSQKINRNVNPNSYNSYAKQSYHNDLNQNKPGKSHPNHQGSTNTSVNFYTRGQHQQKNVQLQKSRINSFMNQNPSQSETYTTLRKQLPITQPRNYRLEVINLQNLLDVQRNQKFQLQQIIKQLTVNTQKLKQVNDHLVERLKQIEKSFVQQKQVQERQQNQMIRKTASKVYEDVEEYVRYEVENVANKLKGQKMSPLLERKLQLFMESMLQVNQNTVEMLKMSRKRNSLKIPLLFQSLRTNQKQNSFQSASKFQYGLKTNKPGIFEFVKESSLGKGSKKRQTGSPQQIKRLINNRYISSSKQERKQPPSHMVSIDGYRKDRPRQEYNDILGQFQNQAQRHQQESNDRSSSPQRISFMNPLAAGNKSFLQAKQSQKNLNKLSQSHIKNPYRTTSYEQQHFNVNQHTPNKRRKIFDGQPGRSLSRRNESVRQHVA